MKTPYYQLTDKSFIATLKRNIKKIKIILTFLFLVFSSFFIIKFFLKKEDLSVDMNIINEINVQMNRILKLKTREQQNEEFRKLNLGSSVTPIRMTLTTAVFSVSKGAKKIILKRVILNPENNLNEDQMCMKLNSPYICEARRSFRTYQNKVNNEYCDYLWIEDKEFLPDRTLVWIVFEYLDVRISIKSVGGNENIIRAILKDALLGLEYMHSRNIAHLDIKIGNIMGKSTKEGTRYKLIDFGYSQEMPEDGFKIIPNKNYGTYPYKPPEVVNYHEHGIKSDIWSIGAVCWFLSLEHTPFYLDDSRKDVESYKKFLRKKTSNPKDKDNHQFTFSRKSSRALMHFVKTAMQVDPAARPTASQLLRHPFITGEPFDLYFKNSDDLIEDYDTDDDLY